MATLTPPSADALRATLPDLADDIIVAIANEVPDYARAMEGRFGEVVRFGVEVALNRFVDVLGGAAPKSESSARDTYVRLGAGGVPGRPVARRAARRLPRRRQAGVAALRRGGHAGGLRAGRAIRPRRGDVRLYRRDLRGERRRVRRGAVGRGGRVPAPPPRARAAAHPGAAGRRGDRAHGRAGRGLELPAPARRGRGGRGRRAGARGRAGRPRGPAGTADRPGRGRRRGRRDGDRDAARPGGPGPAQGPGGRAQRRPRRAGAGGRVAGGGDIAAPRRGRVPPGRAGPPRPPPVCVGGTASPNGQSSPNLVVAVEHLPALLLAAEPALAADLARSRLAPLDGLAAGPRERLVETLKAWLDRPGQVQAVAAELDVHPQTVRYRLKQLRELFGERLEDPEARFELSLALRAADGVRYT